MPRRCLQTAFVALAACLLCAVQHAACQAPEPFCSCVPLTTKYFFTTPPTTTTATTTTQTTTTPTTSTTATTTTTAQSTTSKICAAVNGMVDKNYIPDAAISGARVGPAGEFRITKGDQMVVNYLAENNCLSGGGTFTIRLCIGGNIQSALVSYRSSENGRFVPMPGSAAASVNAPNSKLCFDINMLIVELAFQPLTLKPTCRIVNGMLDYSLIPLAAVKNAKWGTFTGWSVNKSAVMEIDLVLGSCRSPILVHRLCVNGNVKQAHILFRSVSTAIFTELSSSLDVVSDALDLCYNISTTVAQFAIFPVQLKSSFSSCSPFNGLSSNAYLPEFAIWGAVLDPGTGYNMLRVSSGYLNIDLTVFGCRSHSVYIDQVCLLGNVKQAGLQLKRSIGGSFEASSLSNTVTGDLMSNNLCYTIRQNITAIRIAPSLLKSYDTCPLVEGIQNPLVIPNMDIAFEGSRDSISGAFYMQPGRLMIIDVSARGCRPATYVSQPNNYNYSNYNYHNYTYNYNANNSNDIIDNNHNYSNYNFDNSNHANYDCNHYYDFYCDYYTVHNFNNFYHYDHNTYNDVNNANYNKHHDHNTNNKHINHYNNAYYNYYNYDADYNINHDNKHNYNSNVPNTSTYGVKICLLGGNVRRANLFIRQSALHSLEPYASLTSDTQVPICFSPTVPIVELQVLPQEFKSGTTGTTTYMFFMTIEACFNILPAVCLTLPSTTSTTTTPTT
uniref:Membrane-associated protein n=1 Tax=Macrostomum lignano TaxID=282301 RepID=A0A1I8HYN9_9PLAT